MTFERGDIVAVDYKSPRLIEEWMTGLRPVGPGDVGVVKFSPVVEPIIGHRRFDAESATSKAEMMQSAFHNYTVTVEFPMIGTYGVHSSNLRLVERANTKPFVAE